MRSRKRSPDGPDTDSDNPGDVSDPDGTRSRSGLESGAEPPISEADAEEEVAKAEARAAAARARVAQLRQTGKTTQAEGVDDVAQDVEQRPENAVPKRRRRLARRPARPRWLRRPGRKAVAACAGFVLVCSSVAASGYMVWQHNRITHNRQLAAEFAAAARQGVTTLMSLDGQHAKEDIQRLIDSCTDPLKSQIEATSGVMAKRAEDSKVVSKVTVEAVAVESVTDNSGVVLVAAKSDVTEADNTKRPPALWRLSVGLNREGGQLKMSKVDFLQ